VYVDGALILDTQGISVVGSTPEFTVESSSAKISVTSSTPKITVE